MFCDNCGAQLPDGAVFCGSCGSKTEAASKQASVTPTPPPSPEPAVAPAASNSYSSSQQTSYTPSAQSNPQSSYSAPGGSPGVPPMSVGQYVGMILLTMIPFVGIILLFVWAFGSDVNLNKKNLARAQLIMALISIVLGFIIVPIIISVIGAGLGALSDWAFRLGEFAGFL